MKIVRLFIIGIIDNVFDYTLHSFFRVKVKLRIIWEGAC